MLTGADILIVDDNPNNLMLLARILQKAGHQVRAANDGPRALNIMQMGPPELVMLDINLPDMDGYEICRRLKADEALRDIPVVFISALDEPFDKVRAFQAGGVDYITKPFHPEEVLARAEAHLKFARLREELEARNRELEQLNESLLDSLKRTEIVFSALSKTLPGTLLDDKYRLDEQIGSGGYGAVYRAMHVGLQRPVAVKVFRPVTGNSSPDALRRFTIEGMAACRINHRNAVTVYDCSVSSDGIAYLVMELLEGPTLAEVMEHEIVLSPRRCLEIIAPICDVLAEVHAAGMVHRDIKPQNVMLHRAPEGEVVKVLDFGIVKLLRDRPPLSDRFTTETGHFVGTPPYMSPELLLNLECDGRADVFSVGVLLYRMLGGRAPFADDAGSLAALIVKCLHHAPPPIREVNPKVPPAVAAVVARALAKAPADRPWAGELAADLRAAVDGAD